VRISLAEKDFDETSKLLTVMREKFGGDLAQEIKASEFAEYVQSPQYRAWLSGGKRE
jgi:hypothetical protein